MKTTKTILALMLLCSVLSSVAFAVDEPLNQIRKHDTDPDGVDGACDGVEFSVDGSMYVAGDNHGTVRVYRTSDGAYMGVAVHDYNGGTCAKSEAEINGCAFSPDGLWLATGDGGADGTKIWDATLFSVASPADLGENDALHHVVTGTESDGLAFSPNNEWLATAADLQVVVFEVQDFSGGSLPVHKTISPGATGAINSIDFSSDSKYMVCAGGGDDWIFVYSTPALNGGNTWTQLDSFRTVTMKA